MFEKAVRNKYRFVSVAGPLSVEDLWDLPLTSAKNASLDEIAIGLDKIIRETSVSFVNRGSANAKVEEAREKLDIVTHIINVKLAENAARANAAANKEHNQKILERIAAKQNQALDNLSIEELQALMK